MYGWQTAKYQIFDFGNQLLLDWRPQSSSAKCSWSCRGLQAVHPIPFKYRLINAVDMKQDILCLAIALQSMGENLDQKRANAKFSISLQKQN